MRGLSNHLGGTLRSPNLLSWLKTLSFICLILFGAQTSWAFHCSSLLTIPKTIHNPVNVAFYMERSTVEAFRDLGLEGKKITANKLKEDLLAVKGYPHFVIQSESEERVLVSLPKGLRFSARIRRSFWSLLKRNEVVLEDFQFMSQDVRPAFRRDVQRLDEVDLVQTQARMQLEGSSTFQKHHDEDLSTFFTAQVEAFGYLLDRLDQDLDVEDLVQVNRFITKESVLRRPRLDEDKIGLVRGRDSATRLTQENTGLNYMPPEQVPEAFDQLLERINHLDEDSTLLDVAEIYQDFILIHPFPDGNGRTSRALVDYLLLRIGQSPLNHNRETSHIMYYSSHELSRVLFENLRWGD